MKQQSDIPSLPPPLLPPCSNRNTSLSLQRQKRDQSNRIKHEELLVAASLFLNEAAWQLPWQSTFNITRVRLWSWGCSKVGLCENWAGKGTSCVASGLTHRNKGCLCPHGPGSVAKQRHICP